MARHANSAYRSLFNTLDEPHAIPGSWRTERHPAQGTNCHAQIDEEAGPRVVPPGNAQLRLAGEKEEETMLGLAVNGGPQIPAGATRNYRFSFSSQRSAARPALRHVK
jgi:hypothetical protein